MIIKHKDQQNDQIDYLSDLLERDLPDEKICQIERDLVTLKSGLKGEENSAYYLDFHLHHTKNWCVIHDLRIEHDSYVAQIDHLVIGRWMDIYVIESKNFASGVSISDEGDFSYFYKDRPFSIPSPIEQNERHITLLNRFLKEKSLLPTRLGITIKPTYHNIVLISPKSRLTKPKKGLFDCSGVMKSDKFFKRLNDDINDDSLKDLVNVTKIISQDSLKLFAEKLVLFHEPSPINYKLKYSAEFKSDSIVKPEPVPTPDAPACPKCGKEMVKRVAQKGKNSGKEFWGCSDYPACKATLNVEAEEKVESPDTQELEENSPTCPKCDGPMIKRTIKKGEKAGEEFWGCGNFPKCRGTVSVD
jgi:predicted RNA-binding Zn-ribbon protein involved in translation (DUF1610 family)